eukprot:gene12256-34535_t
MVGADTSQTDTCSSTPLQMWSPTTTTAPLHQLCYNNQMKNMACSPTITRTYSAAFAHYDDITYVPACLGNHIIPSATSGALLHLLQDVVFGGQKPSVRGWGIYSGFLFTYSGLQCPMEQLHRRKSLLHNFAAGSILGYIGVSGGFVGIPFMQNVTLPKVLRSRQAFLGAGIYGTLAMAFGAFSGKPF